jgi:multiple sugar transport system substrate-binding protein
MKKLVVFFMCFVFALTAFTGPARAEVIELSLWHYWANPVEHEHITRFVQMFNEAHPGIRVTETLVPRDDLLRQYTMGAVAGELPDIGMVDNPDHASFSAMGTFEDITELVMGWGQKDFFFEGPMMSTMYEGRIYGIPNNSNCLALFYNKDILEAAGVEVPTTWEELEAACATLTHDDVYGLAISAVMNEEGTFQFMPWFISADGSIDDLGGPGPVKAVSFLKGLIDKGYMSGDVINWTQSDANQQFMNGKAAMQINGPWNVPGIERDAPDLNWGVALIPRDVKYASVLGGENFAICANPTNLYAAFNFLTWFHSAETLARWCDESGRFPPRSDSIKLRDLWTTDPVFGVFGEALQYAMPRGPHPRWPEISNAMSTAFHEVFMGVRSAEDAMKAAAEKYNELVQ